MKIYIAGRFSRQLEFREVAKRLEDMGHEVTSRWLFESVSPNHTMGDITPAYAAKAARLDLADIDEADAMLFYAEDPLVGTPRGGRHVEFGYALARGKLIYVVGHAENIFHYGQPMVISIPSVEYLAPVQVVGF